jgi:predicted metal-dependent phosphoesterase TrpH
MIDLHIHTKFSDGTDGIDAIINKVIDKGVHVFAITDHDTIDGVCALLENDEQMMILERNNIKFVPGIEFSSILDGNKIHLLGYDCNLGDAEFLNAIELGWLKRRGKYELRLQALREQLGIEYSASSLEEMNKLKYVGKPIMANYLVKDGFFDNRQDAILNGIHKLKLPAQEVRLDANIVIPAIVGAEGICVWAHPLGGEGEEHDTEKVFVDKLEKIMEYGIQGLECYYSRYSKSEAELLVKYAKKYNLLISGGSDYHGTNKNIPLGRLCSDNSKVEAKYLDILKKI